MSVPASIGSTSCICKVGYFGVNGGLCTACPLYSSSLLGSKSIIDCTCNAGYLKNNEDLCTTCAADYFGGKGEPCNTCPEHSNSIVGSSIHTNCACKSRYTTPLLIGSCLNPNTTGTTTTIDHDYSYITFINTGTIPTFHDIHFRQNTSCDILIVGGGGGGGNGGSGCQQPCGGGGAGGVVYIVNKIFNSGTYKVRVGNGGTTFSNGIDSTITETGKTEVMTIDNIPLIRYGGGRATRAACGGATNGRSGGGGGPSDGSFGRSTQGNTLWNGTMYIAGGFDGGNGAYARAGGGGGSNESGGFDFNGAGGDGTNFNITGIPTFYAGGGQGVYYVQPIPSDGGGGTPNQCDNSCSISTIRCS